MIEIALFCLIVFPFCTLCSCFRRYPVIWNAIYILFIVASAIYLLINSPEIGVLDWHYEIAPFFTLRYILDYFVVQFLVLITVLWLLAAIYAWSYLEVINHPRPGFFMFFYNLSVVAAIFTAMSGNLQTMFMHYELLTICTAPLIAELGTPHAERSLKVYLGYLMFTSLVLFLPAIIIIYSYVGHTDFTEGGILISHIPSGVAVTVFAMLFYGIAKTALMPAHGWLPAAMVAYHPVSALLHAVAVVNIGLFCMCRVVTHIFGMQYLNELFASMHGVLLSIPVFTVLAASIIALRQDTVKRMLAYSTISQLSMVLISLLLFTPNALQVAFVFMMLHSINKIGLFFCAGNIYVITRYTKIAQFAGLAKFAPHTAICFTILGLSLIGVPPLAGFWGKYGMIIEGAYLLQSASYRGYFVFLVVVIGSLFTAWYILSVIVRLYDEQSYSSARIRWQNDLQISETHRALMPMRCITYITALLAITVPLLLLFL